MEEGEAYMRGGREGGRGGSLHERREGGREEEGEVYMWGRREGGGSLHERREEEGGSLHERREEERGSLHEEGGRESGGGGSWRTHTT